MARDEVQARLEALRRAQILDAAERVFAREGYRVARVQDVAREAGVANGTVYNYFPNKEALLFGLLDRLNETEARPAQFARLEHESARDALAAVIRHRFEVMGEGEALLRAIVPELLVNAELRRRYIETLVAPSLRLGAAGLEPRIGAERAELATRAMASAVFGVVMFRLLDEPVVRARADDLAELLADVFAPVFEGSETKRRSP